MKKILLPIMIVAIGVGFYEQTKPVPNLYVKVIAIAVFMLGLMWFSAKVPSKNPEKNDDEV